MNKFTLKWLMNNPNYEYQLFNDDEIDQYIHEKLTDKDLLNLFDNFPLNILKTDFWRMFVLY